jgi:N-acetylglucosaminyldiphosphoundecaprenol N-acetyl-beta-D-mannosaminyltransferase
MSSIETVTVGGFATARLSRDELTALMVKDCLAARTRSQRSKAIFDLNGHGLALAEWNRDYRADLRAADLIHADGQPCVIASRLLTSTPIPERTVTTDVFQDAAAAAAAASLSFFLLGATEDNNASCAEEMERRYPGLKIVGRRNGYFAREEEAAICDEINHSGADIVWVGLGKPKEQAFCIRNRDRLQAGWLVTCGGCFNYVSGLYGRAPLWMQQYGLEWLFRLVEDPRRFGWRYLSTNLVALYILLTRTRSIRVPQDAIRTPI